jgi:chromosome segregation ATPase
MTRLPRNGFVVLVLCCLPVLAGCHEAERKKALADLQTTETALAQANQELATTRTTLETTRKERDSLQKEVQGLKIQNSTQQKRLDERAAEMQASGLQTEQLKKQVAELTTQVQTLEAQNNELKKQLAAASDAAKENESLKTKMAALQKDGRDRRTAEEARRRTEGAGEAGTLMCHESSAIRKAVETVEIRGNSGQPGVMSTLA